MPNLQKKSLMVSNTRSSTRSMTTMSSTLIREPAIFQANGVPLNKSSFFDKLESRLQMKPKNVIFLGENHSDPSSHILELEILKRVADLRPGETALSLEFYDRSAQSVLDEYLLGSCTCFFYQSLDHVQWTLVIVNSVLSPILFTNKRCSLFSM